MTYMAIDQCGGVYHDLGKHPRKQLLNILMCKHASKMYTDKKSGESVHIGYIIKGLWLTLYEVKPFEKPV